MKFKVVVKAVLLVFIITNVFSKFLEDNFTDKCCDSCKLPEIKYYSIDTRFNHCGESCMDPKYFWIYKVFEKGLTKADSNTPCKDLTYTKYFKTETHGVYPITATVDLYDKEK